MGNPPYQDPDTLARLYYDEQLSMADIGDRFGVTRQTIYNWMERFGMDRRGVKESHRVGIPAMLKDPDELHTELIDKERTRQDVADELGVTKTTVIRWAGLHGIGSAIQPSSSTVACDYCGSELSRQRNRLNRAERQFCDNECRGAWVSEHNTGEDNPNWRGGHYIYGPSWTENLRKRIRERDGHECRVCGCSQDRHLDERGEVLHVHHITPARKFDDHEKRNEPDNLITLCRDCHKKWEGSPILPQ